MKAARRFVLAAAQSASLLGALGCGAADETTAPREPETSPVVEFTPSVNVCPRFEGSLVLPQTILHGQIAVIVVRAIDPDGDDGSLTYTWSASSGELTHREGTATEYSCGELGPQVLTVVTKDERNCHVSLAIDVTCLGQ